MHILPIVHRKELKQGNYITYLPYPTLLVHLGGIVGYFLFTAKHGHQQSFVLKVERVKRERA